MSLKNLFSNSSDNEFAEDLAREFVKSFPPELLKDISNKKVQLKFKKAITRIEDKARSYSSNVKLGLYSRAKIGNTFMWVLKDCGYEADIIENITNDLLHSLGKKQGTRT